MENQLSRARMLMRGKVSTHVETCVLLINQNPSAKHYVEIGIDAEDHYKIKDSKCGKI